jgi:3-mercaptopyruvate sulfurtransferase SseA
MRATLTICSFLAAVFLFAACAKVAPVAEVKKMEKDADVPRISVADAKKEFDAGKAIIVDSRPDTAYSQEHIAGSINIPFGSNANAFSTLPKDKKIIVYCS